MSDAATLTNRLRAFAQEEGLPLECLFDDYVIFDKAADDGMASTATADTKIWNNPYDFPVQIVGLSYSATGGGITADAANFAQINAKTDDGLGGATTIGMQLATTPTANGGTGNIAANVGVQTAVKQSGGGVVPVNGNLFIAIVKQGTGVVVRAGKINVRLRRI
jgi:hypothetical protein